MEKIFINNFIVKSKRERLLYELSNAKKRKDAIGRFCHNSQKYIDESKIIYQGNSITKSDLLFIINKYTDEKQCYLIAWKEELDQHYLEKEEALDSIIGNGMAAIMVFRNLAVIEMEQVQGPAIKYVLAKNCKPTLE